MTLFDDMAFPIPGLIAVEVIVRLISASRHGAFVTVTRVIAVIDMAGEVRRAVEPGAGTDKQAANKPIGPVVAVRRAVVWGVGEVAIGADGRHSNVDGDLSRRRGRAVQKSDGESCASKHCEFGHKLSSIHFELGGGWFVVSQMRGYNLGNGSRENHTTD